MLATRRRELSFWRTAEVDRDVDAFASFLVSGFLVSGFLEPGFADARPCAEREDCTLVLVRVGAGRRVVTGDPQLWLSQHHSSQMGHEKSPGFLDLLRQSTQEQEPLSLDPQQ